MIGPLGGQGMIGAGLGRAARRVETPWWLLGGVSPLAAFGAWRSRGAVSYAASMLDLSGNGNHLTEGNPTPWSAANGWVFYYTATPPGYLITTFVPDANQSQTAIYAEVDGGSGSTFRSYGMSQTGVGNFGTSRAYGSACCWYNGGAFQQGPKAACVTAVVGNRCFRDGVYVRVLTSGYTGTPTLPVFVGACNTDGVATFGARRYGRALALYNEVLTDEQVALISAAMAAI